MLQSQNIMLQSQTIMLIHPTERNQHSESIKTDHIRFSNNDHKKLISFFSVLGHRIKCFLVLQGDIHK